jgi:long-chain fatty acid transport protein
MFETVRFSKRLAAAAAFAAFSIPAAAWAGGILLYEVGTPDVGLASAGYAARAEDAATAVTNPAGMKHLSGTQVMAGAQALYGDLSFSPNENTTTTGGDGGNPIGFFPGGGVFFTHEHSDLLRLGLAAYGNFGLPLDYEEDWVGRYYIEQGTILGLTVAPSFAFCPPGEIWSVGFGMNFMYGIFSSEAAVNNPGSLDDGALEVEDEDWGFGATLGFFLEPDERTRVGATFTSEIELEFRDAIQFTDVGAGVLLPGSFETPLNLDMTAPRTFMGSFYREIDEHWALLGNVGFQEWSQFGKPEVTLSDVNTTTVALDRDYKDTWHAALGAQKELSEVWRLTFGAAYDSSPVDDENRTPDAPLSESWRFALGGRRAMSESFDLGFGYTWLYTGALPMDQERGRLSGRLAGEYEGSGMHFLAVHGSWTL